MATGNLSWKVHDALRDFDRKQNYLQHAKDCVKEKCLEAVYVGALLLGASGVLGGLLCGSMAGVAGIGSALFPKKVGTYETSRHKNNAIEARYSGLAKKVSEKTGVDERILLGFIAGGRTRYADDLRKEGYSGIVPLRPEEAGVTAETLSNDDEQCLLSATRVFKEITGKQNSHNLEAVVGCFWHREKEEEAKQNSAGWSYVQSAREAYERRMHYDYAAHFEERLMQHEGALAAKAHIEQNFSGLEKEYWISRSSALQNEIKDPAFLFHCNIVIEANKRYKAGEEFTWIDLLPVKLAAAIGCSVAYMDGVCLK